MHVEAVPDPALGVADLGLDNDGAADMVAALSKKVKLVTEASDTKARGYYAEARVAIQFVLAAHGTDILGGPSLDDAIDALARMRRDTAWLAGAREPKQFARVLENELATVLARMTACKGCRRADKDGSRLKNTLATVKAACAVPIPKRPKSTKPNRNNLGLRPGQARPKRVVRVRVRQVARGTKPKVRRL